MIPLCNNPKTNYDCGDGKITEEKNETNERFVFDTEALNFGEVVTRLEKPTNSKERNGRREDIKESEEVTGVETGVDFEDVNGGNEIKWKGEDKLRNAGRGAKHKSVGAGFGGPGAVVESGGELTGDKKLGACSASIVAK